MTAMDAIKGLGLTTAPTNKPKRNALDQEQFLKLMTTQMTHQDPTKPMQNGEFITQMAQFGTVSRHSRPAAIVQGFRGLDQLGSGLAGDRLNWAPGIGAL